MTVPAGGRTGAGTGPAARDRSDRSDRSGRSGRSGPGFRETGRLS